MEWTADLKDFDDYIIVPASHGGPIGAYKYMSLKRLLR